ncbi:MAG: NosD domain-containing protein [Candidatus Bathyarchaeales archaeon]
MKQTQWTMAIVLTLLFLVAVFQHANVSFANFFPDPGSDLPHIYIKSDGSVEPATAPIERIGNYYKLKENITMKTIVIQRDNIVLDGSHHLIEGSKSWMGLATYFGDAGNNGIIIAGRNNVKITNLNIERFTTGIRISNSSYINIFGNSFKEETAVFDTPAGITIEASSHILIENNIFTSINGPAIFCDGANIIIRGNTLNGIFDSIDGSIALKGSSNIITDNKIETVFPSIRLSEASANIIARNHIEGGISLISSSNNMIFGNNLTSIRLIFSSNNTIHGNCMTSNIRLDTIELDQGTANNTFYGNSFPANCSVRINDAGTNFWDNGTMGNC